MRKLLLFFTLLGFTTIGYTAYLTEKTYKVVPDTTTIKNDWYYDGDINIGISTSTINAVILDDGKLGIGLSTPIGLVEVSTGTSSYSLYISSLAIQVGIGTNNPTSDMELDVSGDINSTSITTITGTATDLTTDDLTITYGFSTSTGTATDLTTDDLTITYGFSTSTGTATDLTTDDLTITYGFSTSTGTATDLTTDDLTVTYGITASTLTVNAFELDDLTVTYGVFAGTGVFTGTIRSSDVITVDMNGSDPLVLDATENCQIEFKENSTSKWKLGTPDEDHQFTLFDVRGDQAAIGVSSGTSVNDVGIAATAKLFLDGTACTGNTYIREGEADKIELICGGTTRVGIDGTRAGWDIDLACASAGSYNVGDATFYWGDISYKTITDRGCLGWFDEGVELQNGSIVTDTEALLAIQKHPKKLTVYGVPMLDYSTMPKCVYKPADKAGEILPRDENDEPYWLQDGVKMQAADGAETTALISIMIGAIKELTLRIQALEAK